MSHVVFGVVVGLVVLVWVVGDYGWWLLLADWLIVWVIGECVDLVYVMIGWVYMYWLSVLSECICIDWVYCLSVAHTRIPTHTTPAPTHTCAHRHNAYMSASAFITLVWWRMYVLGLCAHVCVGANGVCVGMGVCTTLKHYITLKQYTQATHSTKSIYHWMTHKQSNECTHIHIHTHIPTHKHIHT